MHQASERSLCLVVLQSACTESCLEEFVLVGGMRALRLWTREYENAKDIAALTEVAKVCCKIPFNVRTKSAITASGIPKNIKKLSKTDSKEHALQCMRLWGEGNRLVVAQLEARAAAGDAAAAAAEEGKAEAKEPPPKLFEELRDIIAEKRNEFVSNR